MSDSFAAVPYHQMLGLEVLDAGDDRVRVRLPFMEANSNPGGALHGGVTASAIVAAGALAGHSGAGVDPALAGAPVDVFLAYLAAAISEPVIADAHVLRRGKELRYVEVDVRTDHGKEIARGLLTYRLAPPSAAARERSTCRPPDTAGKTVPPFAKFFVLSPFIGRLGLAVEHAAAGMARTRMPWNPALDAGGGAAHEGAIAALVDTTAAIAAWSLVPLDPRNKASTVDLHVSWCGPAPGDALVAVAETLQRQNEIFINTVAVTAARTGRVVAVGTVTYRIVVPEE
jgi:uncharacterized protein (TIGR00369 family)